MIQVPGDMLEGGGQIVRTSVSLSALLGREVYITNVRAKRRPPGFRAQHVAAVKAVASVSGARVEGLRIGSTSLVFSPKARFGGDMRFEVGTAGSVTLVLQAVMPVAGFADRPSKITVSGGTDVSWSPSIDYLRLVTLPNLCLMGYEATLTIHRRGHYPRGGGEVTLQVRPVNGLKPLNVLERGELVRVYGVSHCVQLPRHVAERQARAAEQVLKRVLRDVSVEAQVGEGTGPGSGVALAALTEAGTVLGADSLGERGKPAEKVGEEAAEKLLEEIGSGAALDRHMGDMVIPYMAVAGGRSKVTVSRMTQHTLTNVRVTELIAGVRFLLQERTGGAGTVEVEGLGLAR